MVVGHQESDPQGVVGCLHHDKRHHETGSSIERTMWIQEGGSHFYSGDWILMEETERKCSGKRENLEKGCGNMGIHWMFWGKGAVWCGQS